MSDALDMPAFEEFERSTEPTEVVGNEASMMAVAEQPEVLGIAGLVVRWQTARTALVSQTIADTIMRELKPTLRKVASRFTPSARGSLSIEDLEQVAAIEAFKFMSKYDHASAGSTTFEQHVYRRAMTACQQQVEMHAHDVRPSLHLQRASRGQGTDSYKGRKVEAACRVESNDSVEIDGPNQTPEEMLSDAQTISRLRAALMLLPEERREIVREAFGLGTLDTGASLRDIARRRRVPRSRLATEITEALTQLRRRMEREPGCP